MKRTLILSIMALMGSTAISATSLCPDELLKTLNTEHLARHSLKEIAMWEKYMGRARKTEGAFEVAESELGRWASDPEHLRKVRAALKTTGLSEATRTGLEQLQRFFEANVRPDTTAPIRTIGKWFGIRKTTADLFHELMRLEQALGKSSEAFKFSYHKTGEAPEEGTLSKMRLIIESNPDETARRTAYEAMRGFELNAIQNGMIPIIKQRNLVARRLGFADYYEWKVRTNERMTKKELFDVLDSMEANTRQAAEASLAHFEAKTSEAIRRPWNFAYFTKGELAKDTDPYFPLSEVLNWMGQTFHMMGGDLKGSQLTMDLLDRKGKYPNGYIRAPIPSYVGSDGKLVSAVTNFSSNGVPGEIGAGQAMFEVAFHETGHHFNFSGVLTTSVAGSQEESPTSVAAAETHSMFFDDTLSDPMWLREYAKMPWELVKRVLEEKYWLSPFELRKMMTVPYMEKALYEMSDAELTPENILRVAREIEKKLLLVEGMGRPVMSVTHIHSAESSAYYHGYFLASLAVDMTREHFMERDGHVVNNPKVAPEMAELYWAPGNSISFPEMVERLTGKKFSPQATLARINMTLEDYLALQHKYYERAVQLPRHQGEIELNGHFTVEDGDVQITTTRGGKTYRQMSDEYAAWVKEREAAAKAKNPSTAP